MKVHFKKRFTLIELILVLAIVGIFAAIAVPAYRDYTVRANISDGLIVASFPMSLLSEAFQADGVAGLDAASST